MTNPDSGSDPDGGTDAASSAGTEADEIGGTETRIGLGLTRSANRSLVAELLSEYVLVDVAGDIPDDTDLCLVDEAGLEQSRAALETWQNTNPALTPVLLLVEEGTQNPWRRYAPESEGLVSAIQEIPAPQAAVTARVEALLDTRRRAMELAFEHELTTRVFETSPLAKTVLDAGGSIVRANDSAEGVLRLSKSALTDRRYDTPAWRNVDANGEPIPVDDLPFARVMATGEPVSGYEHAIEAPDGELVWLSVDMAPIFDADGDVEFAVATIEDITERRQQDREHERQVDLFRQAQELARVGGWEYDVHADEWWATDVVDEVLDNSLQSQDPLEQFADRVHPADRPELVERFERALDHAEPYDTEFRTDIQSGTERWIRARAEAQVEQGSVHRLRGTVQDITEQKHRQRELERMTRAVDTAPIGVVISDPTVDENPLTYVNDGFLSITGYTREEVLGRNCRFLQGSETDPTTVARVRRAIDAEEPVSVVLLNYRKNGTPFWNNLDIGPVFDSQGNVREFIGFQQDISSRVERQRQLQKIDRYLRHNLRNEMNIISGMAALIRDDSDSPMRERAQSILDHGDSLVGTMDNARVITELLRDEPTPEPLDLASLVMPAIERVRTDSPAVDITASVPDSVTVRATHAVRAAVEELLRNAVTYNDVETPQIRLSAEVVDDETVTVTVSDNGPGIPSMEVDTLTMATQETSVYHGQGLGLWLVYLISQQSGGTVEFADNQPRGSTVTLSLPRDSDERPS